jgi:hypothetical protein
LNKFCWVSPKQMFKSFYEGLILQILGGLVFWILSKLIAYESKFSGITRFQGFKNLLKSHFTKNLQRFFSIWKIYAYLFFFCFYTLWLDFQKKCSKTHFSYFLQRVLSIWKIEGILVCFQLFKTIISWSTFFICKFWISGIWKTAQKHIFSRF